MSLPEVTFQPLSEWQKPECLFCQNPATQEATAHRGSVTSGIRCCDLDSCKVRAQALAVIPFQSSTEVIKQKPMSHLERAIQMAVSAHAGQVDKAGKPYILHPLRVMLAVADYDLAAQIAGVLHDVVEDTAVTLLEIQMAFDPVIATTVDALTRRKDEMYKDFILRIKPNPIATAVKIADIRDNLSRIQNLPESMQSIRVRYEKALAVLND